MLCPECSTYASDGDRVCVNCGKLLQPVFADDEEELMRFRQGRHLRRREEEERRAAEAPVRTAGSRSFEDTRPPESPEATGAYYSRREILSVTGKSYGGDDQIEPRATGRSEYPTVMRMNARVRRASRRGGLGGINWAYVIVGCFLAIVMAVVGSYLYLTRTPNGQILMARMGQDATSEAMWMVGKEYLDTGDLEKAIEYYLIAREKDTEAKAPNIEGLLSLGEAYEANGDLAAAEEVYGYIYTDVVDTNAEAYRSQVRVLIAQGREAEAAELLQTAYQKTKLATFRTQRLELLPAVPAASVTAGYYTEKKVIELLQSQYHDVYYTLDPYVELPGGGILYETPIELGEGEHAIRAVAVNGELVSDELEASYQIYMPTPLQPDCNLAPNTYYKKRTVRIRAGKLTDEELEDNPGYAATLKDSVAQTLTFYYTIDGSEPDADSPIFDPATSPDIVLPTGRVTLKAVAVNGYGKASHTLERTFKFDVKPNPQAVYNVKDTIGDLRLAITTREAFLTKYGEGSSTETVWMYGVDGDCEKHTYPWGYATFMKIKSGWVLADLYFTTGQFSGPRGTGIGMTEKDVVAKFKDFGQIESPSGNRGLYHDMESSDKGKIYVNPEGGKVIRYRTDTADAHVWQLDYFLNDAGTVTAIQWMYER